MIVTPYSAYYNTNFFRIARRYVRDYKVCMMMTAHVQIDGEGVGIKLLNYCCVASSYFILLEGGIK